MFNSIFYLLPFIVLTIGAIAAYNDFKFGKIPNKLVIAGLAASLVLLPVSVLTGNIPINIFWQALLNAVAALALGYSFWYFDLWAAGDAKLFFVLALLLPFRFYWRSYLPVFPSLAILTNAFIPLLIFVFFQSVFLMAKSVFLFFKQDKVRARLDEGVKMFIQAIKINYLSYLWVALAFGLVFVMFQLVRLEMGKFIGGFALGQAGLFFSMAFLGMLAGRAIKNKRIVLAMAAVLVLILSTVRVFYSQNLLISLAQITKNTIPYLAGMGLLFWLFDFYGKESRSKNLHFAFWLLLGVMLTMILNGSLLVVWRR